ncbi:hypothetical protein HYW32_01115, partial [Candidatus Berkelbacteria bacterium]|nr:hypothetical protein [Candidatus Berkelbacteria bacterium]
MECTHSYCVTAGDRGFVRRAHKHLLERFSSYHQWHHHPHHRQIHWAALGLHLALIFSLVLSSISSGTVFAATNNWTFATAGDYTLSSSDLLEVTGSASRLKVRNYANDSNTKAL